MRELNYLQTRTPARYDHNDPEREGNKNTTFADLIIDGKSLYQMLKKYEMVPSLGWGSIENQKQMIVYFLLFVLGVERKTAGLFLYGLRERRI